MPCTFDFILILSKSTLHMDIHVQYIYWVLNSVMHNISNFFLLYTNLKHFFKSGRLKLSFGLGAHWIQVHLKHGFRVEFTKRSWCINKNRYNGNWKFKFCLQCPRHCHPRTALWPSVCANEYRNMSKEWNSIWNNVYKFVTTRLYVMIMWLYQMWIFFYISVNRIREGLHYWPVRFTVNMVVKNITCNTDDATIEEHTSNQHTF